MNQLSLNVLLSELGANLADCLPSVGWLWMAERGEKLCYVNKTGRTLGIQAARIIKLTFQLFSHTFPVSVEKSSCKNNESGSI